MARESFASSLDLIFRHEGGYVDHLLDPGGATNFGITRATLASVRGRPVSKAEVLALTRREAGEVYLQRYWNAVGGDDLPPGVDLVVFDAAVNSGPARAARWLQAALGVPQDGVVGPLTIAAARRMNGPGMVVAYSETRMRFLRRLTAWRTFGRGWTRRVRETEAAALALAGQGRGTPIIARRKDNSTVTDTKSLLTSKTLWSNVIGLGAIMLSLFGIDASSVDGEGLSQAIPQAVAALSFIASAVFRIRATKRLALS